MLTLFQSLQSPTSLLSLPTDTELAGRYRIKRVLGVGGFSITYLAEFITQARIVVIKEYFPIDFAARSNTQEVQPQSLSWAIEYYEGLDRFILEGKALACFDHACIPCVYHNFLLNNTGYIVFQFVQGKSFKAWLKSIGHAPHHVQLDAIISPILSALETIHGTGLIHCDIAPDNIIIRNDGNPALIDFGSVCGNLSNSAITASRFVKPGFSPYEQYTVNGGQQGPWTDIYSFGAVLYQAVTGMRPIDAPSRVIVDELVPTSDSALNSYRPRFLSAIDKALSLAIEQRPQSMANWRDELLF